MEAVHQLLTGELHVRHLRAVIGFSMGAQQALQWAVSYPDYMDRLVATSGTAKAYGHQVVRLESEIAAIEADQAFNGGDYTKRAEVKGVEAFSLVWTAWLYSQEWWRKELWREENPKWTNVARGDRVLSRPLYCRRGCERPHPADADVGAERCGDDAGVWRGRGGGAAVDQGAGAVYAVGNGPVFPVEDARYEAGFIPHCTLLPIPSLWGHPAGAGASPADARFLNEHIAAFLGLPAPVAVGQ